MKKIISLVVMLSLCVVPLKSTKTPVVKTKALNIPTKISYSDFGATEKQKINMLSEISNDDPTAKAAFLNKIDNANLYEYCLKETLDVYYGNIETYLPQLTALKKSLSSVAEDIVENYEVAAKERATAEKKGYSPTEVLVSLDPETSKETIETIGENIGNGYEVIFDGVFDYADDIPEHRKKAVEKNKNKNYGPILSIDVDLDKTTNQTMQDLSKIACVKSCSRNGLVELEAVVSDFSQEPRLDEQYYLDRINLGDAWQAVDNTTYRQEIIVAVLDSGLDLDHQDVVGNFYDAHSVDVTKQNYPKLSQCSTTFATNHGTAVWGAIRAIPKNKKGITGMYYPLSGYNRMIKTMMVKIVEDNNVEGNTTIQYLIRGINYAVESGASVINISFSTNANNANLYNAILNAYNNDVIIVAAAGNEASNTPRYPASYNEVIGVAATGETEGDMWLLSNNNANIDICAPGENLLVLDVNDNYRFASGTSLSAPLVAGAIALVDSVYIHEILTPSKAKELLTTTDKNDDLNVWENHSLDVGKAVERARYLVMRDETFRIRSIGLSNSNRPKVRWHPFEFASCEGFVIYRATSENGTYSAVSTVKYSDAHWDGNLGCHYWYDSNAESGRTYYYKIRAYVKYGTGKKYSNYTGVKSITVP